jgi:hypothetical protein
MAVMAVMAGMAGIAGHVYCSVYCFACGSIFPLANEACCFVLAMYIALCIGLCVAVFFRLLMKRCVLFCTLARFTA